MRMVHYFGALATLVIPALLWTSATGALGSPAHVGIGLFSAILCGAAHSLTIVFMIVTGRVLKEAMQARPLGRQFLEELNTFFARKRAYPAALFAVLAVVAAAVLGYGRRAFGLPAAVHWAAGLFALVYNLWAIAIEYRVLAENQRLVDRVAAELDRIDRESALAESGVHVDRTNGEERYDTARIARWGRIVAISAWLPYLYWALIVWKGRFDRVSVHPWVEGSIAGLIVWWIARREAKRGSTGRLVER
jgi:hypothetical protein